MLPLTDAVRATLTAGSYRVADDPQLAEVVTALRDDKCILAVKQFRVATGSGLKQAKLAVDAIQAELGSSPETPTS